MSVVAHVHFEKKPTRKHIAERQRRARINQLLEQLEILISSGDSEASPVKLEKAEVLERTVEFIKRSKGATTESTSTYVCGYINCVQSLGNYLKDANLPETILDNIKSHLLARITVTSGRNLVTAETNNNVRQQYSPYLENYEPECTFYSADMTKTEIPKNTSVHNNNKCDIKPQNHSEAPTSVWRPW